MTDPVPGPPDAAQGPEPVAGALHRRSERRALILCGIGAVVGLIVAGAGLFTAQGTRIAGVPPEDVAIVNQVPILLSDFDAILEATDNVSLAKATPAQKRKVLDQMIREELYVQRGVELGLQNDVVEVRQALVGAVEAQQATDVAAMQPDEDTLRAFYRQHLASYADEGTLTLAELIAPSAAQGQAAAAALRAGRPLAQVQEDFALKPSGRMNDGEEFYFAALIHLGPQLFDVARKLQAGQVSDPVGMADGAHILVVQHNQPPVTVPYDMARDRVLADYRLDKVARMQAGADKFLRKRADIQIAEGFE